MTVAITISFYNTGWRRWVVESTMITDMIAVIIGLSTDGAQASGAAIADRVAVPNGNYDYPRMVESG